MEDFTNDLKKETSQQLKQGAKVAKKSVKDWFEYIQDHPLQSMVFGITIYFALKGLMAKE